MALNLQPKSYLILWVISASFFVAWNEFVVLPYQSYDPASMVTMEMMNMRNPLINLGIILITFGTLSYGLVVIVEFMQKSNCYGFQDGTLTDQSAMRDSQKMDVDGLIKTSKWIYGKLKGMVKHGSIKYG